VSAAGLKTSWRICRSVTSHDTAAGY
jgi:hypothetical protein